MRYVRAATALLMTAVGVFGVQLAALGKPHTMSAHTELAEMTAVWLKHQLR